MKRFFAYITIVPIAAAVIVAACSPKLTYSDMMMPCRYTQLAKEESGTGNIPFEWWRAFGDPVLDTLISKALHRNRNLAVAASRIEQARANLVVARAAYLPSFGFDRSFGADYNYTSKDKIEQAYSVEPTLSWEISLFGVLRNTARAAKASALSYEWAYFNTGLSLSAEVATTYFTILEYKRDLDIAKRSHTLRSESAALTDSMFRYGMTDGVALEQARSLVFSAQADISQYERAIDQSIKSLNTLLGSTEDVISADSLDCVAGLRYRTIEIPAGIPADLLYRRPDIMQTYYDVQQAAAQAHVARAERFPSISLTVSGGVAGNTLKSLVSGNPWIWSAAASIAEPIFAFGKLRNRERAAIENYNQSLYSHEQTILNALSEVETALTDLHTYRTQTEVYARYVDSNSKIATMTDAMFRSGMKDYLSVIDAERTYYESQMQLANLVAERNIAYVNLIKALGGGWGEADPAEIERFMNDDSTGTPDKKICR